MRVTAYTHTALLAEGLALGRPGKEGKQRAQGTPEWTRGHPTAESHWVRLSSQATPTSVLQSQLNDGPSEASRTTSIQKNGCVLSDPRTVPKRCLNLDSTYQPPTGQILLGFPAAKLGGPRGP